MRRGHQKIGDEIILYSLHAPDSLAAACLIPEIIRIHPLNIAAVCHRDDNSLIRNQILCFHLVTDAETGSSVIPVFFRDEINLLFDDRKQLFLIRQNAFIIGNLFFKLTIFRFQLLALQAGQRTKTHVDNGLCLHLCKPKPLHQVLLCQCYASALPDNADNLVDMIQGNQKSL